MTPQQTPPGITEDVAEKIEPEFIANKTNELFLLLHSLGDQCLSMARSTINRGTQSDAMHRLTEIVNAIRDVGIARAAHPSEFTPTFTWKETHHE